MPDDAVAVTQYMTFASLREQYPDFAPALTPGPDERRELERLSDPVRREAWVWGRVLARRCLASRLPDEFVDVDQIEICTRNEQEQSVRPEIRCAGRTVDGVSLSITHSDRAVAIAVSTECSIGIDLVDLKVFTAGSLKSWFTPDEIEMTERGGELEEAAIWSAKEAAYKALNRGESFAPQRIEIQADQNQRFEARWKTAETEQVAIVTVTPIDGHLCALACGRKISRNPS